MTLRNRWRTFESTSIDGLTMQAKREAPVANPNASEMINLFQTVRERTMRIVEPLEIEDYVVQTAPYMSPPRWHLGHTSWFFELLLKKYLPGYVFYSYEYFYYVNFYSVSFVL